MAIACAATPSRRSSSPVDNSAAARFSLRVESFGCNSTARRNAFHGIAGPACAQQDKTSGYLHYPISAVIVVQQIEAFSELFRIVHL